MRHYVAVRAENGRWFYANEGRHRVTGDYGWSPAGACGKWMPCPDCKHLSMWSAEQKACQTCEGRGLVEDPNPCQGHSTAEEAYQHEKMRLLATAVRFYPDSEKAQSQHRCEAEGCGAFTSGSADVGVYRRWTLCAAHRNLETVAGLLTVGESWES